MRLEFIMKYRIAFTALVAVAVVGVAHARALRVREAGLWSPVQNVMGKVAGATAASRADATGAIRAVAALRDRLGISADAEALKVRRSDTDRFGRTHVRLQQVYRGLEVDGRELIVHFGADGEVYEVNGDYLDGLALDTTPAVDGGGATLVVYCASDDASKARLAWKQRRGQNYVFVDARTGDILHMRRIAPRARKGKAMDPKDLPFDGDAIIGVATSTPLPSGTATTVTGTLPEQHGGAAVTVGATLGSDGNTYLATRNEAGIEIAVLDGVASPKFRDQAKAAFSAGNETWFETFQNNAYFTAYSTSPAEDPANALAIVYNISIVLDYYATAFGRASYDGKGGRVAAWRFWNNEIESFDTGYANAFWISENDGAPNTKGCFFFGYDLTGKRSETSLDTCGHELSHGITSWSADLQYEGEPGALNESFSDIIGVACEFAAQPRAADTTNPGPGEADWLFDEDSGEVARSLADPKLYDQPSRYKGANWVDTADTSEDNDNGGVHDNCGVQNFFFYLLSEGGHGDNEGREYDLQGIGVEKAVQIAYHALTAYCGPRTDYAAVTSCWDSAALDLVESGVLTAADHAAVAPAWAAVMESGALFDGTGETVYASVYPAGGTTAMPILVKVGKANRKGFSKVTATLTANGKSWKFTGKASTETGVANLRNRRFGTMELVLGQKSATGALKFGGAGAVGISVFRVSPSITHVSGLDGLCAGVAVSGITALDGGIVRVRYSAKKLPSGVRVNAKTGELSGYPRKAGSGTAIVSAKCTFNVEGEKRPVSAMVSKAVEWQVAALDEFAQGKFSGDGVAISVSKAGKVGGTVMLDGKKVLLSAKSYASHTDGTYVAEGKVRGGTFVIDVDATGVRGILTTAGGATPFVATKTADTK